MVFQGLELRLGERIVIAHLGTTQRARYAETSEKLRGALAGHRRAAVAVQGQHLGLDALLVTSLLDETPGQGRILPISDHPAHDVAAKDVEQHARNIELFRAGRSFKEIEAENVRLPDEYLGQMFSSFAHGMGLGNEWPVIMTAGKGYGGGYDGLLEAGMVMCIESYIGELGGPDGMKLEQQILVTDGNPVVLSSFPFEEDWL